MLDFVKILGCYSLGLAIFGTIGNLIIFYVSLKTSKNSTFILLRYLAISDMIALYFWNLNDFSISILDFDLENYSLFFCRFGSWIQFSSLQSSAWILTLISMDRYFLCKIKDWKKIYFTQGIANISGLILVMFIFLINSNILFTFGNQFEPINGTIITECFSSIPTDWISIWSNIHPYLYSFIPFTLLAIINILLIIDLHQNKRISSADNNSKITQREINTSIIIMTLLFIIMTAPCAVGSMLYSQILRLNNGEIIIMTLKCITFSYHAFNKIVFCLSSKHFLKQIKKSFNLNENNMIPNRIVRNSHV